MAYNTEYVKKFRDEEFPVRCLISNGVPFEKRFELGLTGEYVRTFFHGRQWRGDSDYVEGAFAAIKKELAPLLTQGGTLQSNFRKSYHSYQSRTTITLTCDTELINWGKRRFLEGSEEFCNLMLDKHAALLEQFASYIEKNAQGEYFEPERYKFNTPYDYIVSADYIMYLEDRWHILGGSYLSFNDFDMKKLPTVMAQYGLAKALANFLLVNNVIPKGSYSLEVMNRTGDYGGFKADVVANFMPKERRKPRLQEW